MGRFNINTVNVRVRMLQIVCYVIFGSLKTMQNLRPLSPRFGELPPLICLERFDINMVDLHM